MQRGEMATAVAGVRPRLSCKTDLPVPDALSGCCNPAFSTGWHLLDVSQCFRRLLKTKPFSRVVEARTCLNQAVGGRRSARCQPPHRHLRRGFLRNRPFPNIRHTQVRHANAVDNVNSQRRILRIGPTHSPVFTNSISPPGHQLLVAFYSVVGLTAATRVRQNLRSLP